MCRPLCNIDMLQCLILLSSPVCSVAEVVLEPTESVPALENEKALVVWSSHLAHLVLHCDEVHLLFML